MSFMNTINARYKVTAIGKHKIKVGDIVSFKADVEQLGKVVSVKREMVTVKPHPAGPRFDGNYIKDQDEYEDEARRFSLDGE